MDTDRKFPLFLNRFWIKIIAMIAMTLDHVGYVFSILPLRYIGRLALPLFCFLIAEGVMHTRSFKKYALRLGVMASAISIIVIGSHEIPYFRNNGLSMRDEGIIFVDLLLGALGVYLLMQKKWYLKALVILPIAFGALSYFSICYESCRCYGLILWFPYFIRCQYGWYGIVLIIGFYLVHQLARLFFKYLGSISGVDGETYKGTFYERLALNLIAILMLAFVTIACYLIDLMMDRYFYAPPYMIEVQLMSLLSGAFILLYNGRPGYNKKWFQYGCYLYYPLHIALVSLLLLVF